jgi:ABC-type branched-subunit amino acid transport system substrate-binding protein
VSSSTQAAAAAVPVVATADTPAPAQDLPAGPVERALQLGQAKVAALLPLSGPHAAIGQTLLEAVQLAFGDARGGVPVELLARDTGGTPEGARAAAASAVEAGAHLVIGPLLGVELPAVAEIARTASVPVIGLSNNVAAAAPGVFVLGLLPQAQIDRVVSFARGRGAQRFALIRAEDLYGEVAETAFRAAVTANLGQIAAIERHGSEIASLSAAIKRVADRIDRVDAVVLAGNGDLLLLAATFVPYYDIDTKDKQVLVATAFWDDPRLQQEAALHGAFIAAPLTQRRNEFLARFKEAYGKDAPLLASLGYDAAALAIAAIRDVSGGGQLNGVLTNPSGFEGYDGVFRLKGDGTNQRLLPVLRFQRGGPAIVEPGAGSFAQLAN